MAGKCHKNRVNPNKIPGHPKLHHEYLCCVNFLTKSKNSFPFHESILSNSVATYICVHISGSVNQLCTIATFFNDSIIINP